MSKNKEKLNLSIKFNDEVKEVLDNIEKNMALTNKLLNENKKLLLQCLKCSFKII